MNQEWLAFALVILASTYLIYHWVGDILLQKLADLLLKRGYVKTAMRLKHGVSQTGCSQCKKC